MPDAKPAARADGGGHRNIEIADWKPHRKNTLVGFFSAIFPSGFVMHDLALHEKNGARWIGFPGRQWFNAQGEKQYAQFVEFSSRGAGDRFRDAVLAALDRHLETQR
jgi:hypothetical protein